MTYDDALHTYNTAASRGDSREAIRFARIVREKENATEDISREHWNMLIGKHQALLSKNHGGKRAGAGRKPSVPPEERKVRITASISPELAEALHAYQKRWGGTFSATVEHFLRHGNDRG